MKAVHRTPAIRVRDLEVVRGGTTVLPGISLDVPRGAVTGLLGPSGSGKSTLMRAIVGVQEVTGGEVEVLGLPAGDRAVRTRVGYVTQGASVYPDLTIAENLRYFARLLGAPADSVERALETVGLGGSESRRVENLSGGQRNRVSLAAALLPNPEVLVMDEPTVGLDPLLRRSLWETFRELAASGVTLLVSSHAMDEAIECDGLLLMRDGRIIADAPPRDLLARTGAPDVGAAFISLIEERAA